MRKWKEVRVLPEHFIKNSDNTKYYEDLINAEYVDFSTYKVLEFCGPFYKYVGVRTFTPAQVRRNATWGLSFSVFGEPWIDKEGDQYKGRDGRFQGWPAIWRAVEAAKVRSSCGNSHQKQIDNQLTTGLYRNYQGVWQKEIK